MRIRYEFSFVREDYRMKYYSRFRTPTTTHVRFRFGITFYGLIQIFLRFTIVPTSELIEIINYYYKICTQGRP